MWKKLISLNLALLVAIMLLPFSVFAAQRDIQPADTQVASGNIEKLPTPTGLYWDGIAMKWEGMLDPIENLQYFEFRYFFDLDGDGEELSEIHTSVTPHWYQSYVSFVKLTKAMVEDNGNGYYYFKVRAVSDGESVAGSSEWSELSPAYKYTTPGLLPTPTGLYWENGVPMFSELGEIIAAVDKYSVSIYYGETEDETPERIYGVGFNVSDGYLTSYQRDIAEILSENIEAGWYYFTVQFISGDITVAMDGLVSELSPAYYYEVSEMYPAPTGIEWDGAFASWDGLDSSDCTYEIEFYYGENANTSSDQLNLVSYDKFYKGTNYYWPGLKPSCVYEFGAGYYYFRVRVSSVGSTSDVYGEWSEFSGPCYYNGVSGEKLPAPEGLSWDGKNITWDGLADETNKHLYYTVTYYFGTKADGSDAYYLPIGGGYYTPGADRVVSYPFSSCSNYDLGEGYYFYKVKALSSNVTIATDSEWSELSPAFDPSQVEQITIDGESYIATQDWRGDGWYYYYYGENQAAHLTLWNYSGGSIAFPGDMHISLLGENTIEGNDGCGIYVDGDVYITSSEGNNDYGKLAVCGASSYHAIEATGTLHIPNSMTATGGGVSALEANKISFEPNWPVNVSKGENAESASDQSYIGFWKIEDFYGEEVYLRTERLPYTLTLVGNGGITSGGEDTRQVVFTTGTPGSLHLYYQKDVFTNGNKELLGWSESEDNSSGQFYATDEEYSFPQGSLDATLYAVWSAEAPAEAIVGETLIYPGDVSSIDTSYGDGWYFFEVNFCSSGDLELYTSEGAKIRMLEQSANYIEYYEGSSEIKTEIDETTCGAYLKKNVDFEILFVKDGSVSQESAPYTLKIYYVRDLPELIEGENRTISAIDGNSGLTTPHTRFALFTPPKTGWYEYVGNMYIAGVYGDDMSVANVPMRTHGDGHYLSSQYTYVLCCNSSDDSALYGLRLIDLSEYPQILADQKYYCAEDFLGVFNPTETGEYTVAFRDISYWSLTVFHEDGDIIYGDSGLCDESSSEANVKINLVGGENYYVWWMFSAVDDQEEPSMVIASENTTAGRASLECVICSSLCTKVNVVYDRESVDSVVGIISIYDGAGKMLRCEMVTQEADESGTLSLSIDYSAEVAAQIGSVHAIALNGQSMDPLCKSWSQAVDFSEKKTGEVWAIIPFAKEWLRTGAALLMIQKH